MNKNSFFRIVLLILGISLAFYLFYLGFKEFERRQEIKKQIDFLQEEADRIKNENSELSNQIKYFKTDEYKEQVAKEKLNLKKKGEKVVKIQLEKTSSEKQLNPENHSNNKNQSTENKLNQENYKKWWNYFFKKNE